MRTKLLTAFLLLFFLSCACVYADNSTDDSAPNKNDGVEGLQELRFNYLNTAEGAGAQSSTQPSYGFNGSDVRDAHGKAQSGMITGMQLNGMEYSVIPEIPLATINFPVASKMQENEMYNHCPPLFGYKITDSADYINTMIANDVLLGKLSDPERWITVGKATQQAQNTQTANGMAEFTRNQANSAIDFCATYLTNFTVNGKWVEIREKLFVPIAMLLLLPGAMLTQVRSIIAAGSPILEETQPFEGIIRSVVAVFLIPATALVVNYGIDLSNSFTYTMKSEYQRIFNQDMYQAAICAEVRAFPVRQDSENRGAIDLPTTKMGNLLSSSTGVFAKLEGQLFSTKIEDPCSGTYICPADRADECLPIAVVMARLTFNSINAALTCGWNALCAFQTVYLYYLWFMGPIAAALWVYPMKSLRGALESWVEGVVTVCFWSLLWNITILLMAAFKGVDETGTITMTALNTLATISVKSAFDFVGLIAAAGEQANKIGDALTNSGSGTAGGGNKRGAGIGQGRRSAGGGAGGAVLSGASGLGGAGGGVAAGAASAAIHSATSSVSHASAAVGSAGLHGGMSTIQASSQAGKNATSVPVDTSAPPLSSHSNAKLSGQPHAHIDSLGQHITGLTQGSTVIPSYGAGLPSLNSASHTSVTDSLSLNHTTQGGSESLSLGHVPHTGAEPFSLNHVPQAGAEPFSLNHIPQSGSETLSLPPVSMGSSEALPLNPVTLTGSDCLPLNPLAQTSSQTLLESGTFTNSSRTPDTLFPATAATISQTDINPTSLVTQFDSAPLPISLTPSSDLNIQQDSTTNSFINSSDATSATTVATESYSAGTMAQFVATAEQGSATTMDTNISANTSSVQHASTVNIASDTSSVQHASTVNVAGDTNSVQHASTTNVAGDTSSVQHASTVNVAGDTSSVQQASTANVAGDISSVQQASTVNVAGDTSSVQNASTVNVAGDTSSLQQASTMNVIGAATNVTAESHSAGTAVQFSAMPEQGSSTTIAPSGPAFQAQDTAVTPPGANYSYYGDTHTVFSTPVEQSSGTSSAAGATQFFEQPDAAPRNAEVRHFDSDSAPVASSAAIARSALNMTDGASREAAVAANASKLGGALGAAACPGPREATRRMPQSQPSAPQVPQKMPAPPVSAASEAKQVENPLDIAAASTRNKYRRAGSLTPEELREMAERAGIPYDLT